MEKKLTPLAVLYCFLGTFGVGLTLALGLAIGNRLTGLPLFTQSLHVTNTNTNNYFSAQGEATIHVVPDQAVVNLGIDVTDHTVKSAQDKVNQIMNELHTQLSSLGVADKDIQQINYSLYPDYDWSGSERRLTGYTVDSTVQITTTDFNLLNQIIDIATNVGVNHISNISFSLSDELLQNLQKQARQEAIAQAKANAQELASLTGIRLGKITDVYESRVYPNDDYSNSFKLMGAAVTDTENATNIQAGETTYQYSVSLSYETL